MVTNPHVQNRVKHYDFLLARELDLIERKHEHNLVIHKKLEQTIRHESRNISICSRKKVSVPVEEVVNAYTRNINPHKKRAHADDDPLGLAAVPNPHKTNPANGKASVFMPKYRRLCSKAYRLPPITKSRITPLEERMNSERLWRDGSQAIDKENEVYNDRMSIFKDKIRKRAMVETNTADEHIHTFLEVLPAYEGAQPGFDSFAPSSLYSTRAPVAMK